MRIALVAGEASGDVLGAELIRALGSKLEGLEAVGVAGPAMRLAGCRPLADAKELAVMGIVEVLGSLPKLIRLRRRLLATWLADPPDLFIGIDAPDFNIPLESRLKHAGIKTVHYVSPSVWAWRSYRVRRIAKATDLVLALLPFEKQFYDVHRVHARFVGHPLATQLPWDPNPAPLRQGLGIPTGRRVVAVLPGSRATEYSRLTEPFIKAAGILQNTGAQAWHFVVPLIDASARTCVEHAIQRLGVGDTFTLVDGRSADCIGAADCVLTASGTATLEAMLTGRPMVVAYRLANLTHLIARRLIATPWISLPNLLAAESLVPEFVQDAVEPAALAAAVTAQLADSAALQALKARFSKLRGHLHGDVTPAQAILDLL